MNTIIQFIMDNSLIILAFCCGCLLGLWAGLASKEDKEEENNDN